MKRLYLDLETVGTDKFKADILEIGVLFCEDRKVIDTIDTKVIYHKKYSETTQQEKIDLAWHKINSQEDIDNHNSNAVDFKNVLEVLKTKLAIFGEKVAISGWNNAGFDNLITERTLIAYGVQINELFDYHTRDVMCRMQLFQEHDFVKGTSLQYTHKDLIGTIPDNKFHTAINDCYATKDLDEWIDNEFNFMAKASVNVLKVVRE